LIALEELREAHEGLSEALAAVEAEAREGDMEAAVQGRTSCGGEPTSRRTSCSASALRP
jgi:activator of HSP90 ATPase